jgi:hypothetical protein
MCNMCRNEKSLPGKHFGAKCWKEYLRPYVCANEAEYSIRATFANNQQDREHLRKSAMRCRSQIRTSDALVRLEISK